MELYRNLLDAIYKNIIQDYRQIKKLELKQLYYSYQQVKQEVAILIGDSELKQKATYVLSKHMNYETIRLFNEIIEELDVYHNEDVKKKNVEMYYRDWAEYYFSIYNLITRVVNVKYDELKERYND